MLYMAIWTWKTEKRNEIKKRWSEYKYPKDIKLVGEWIDLTGNRIFVLYEADDPRTMLKVNDLWLDVAIADTVPVIEAKEVAKIMAEEIEK